MRVRPPVVMVLAAVALGAGALSATPAQAGTPNGVRTVRACSTPTRARTFACLAERRTDLPVPHALGPNAVPAGLGPAALQSAYRLPGGSAGTGATVAVVDAYNNPNAESDLATYRAQFGLPACTTGNGCFRKVNQNGGTTPLPANSPGWSAEISLDLDMVSATCPNCHILLVEASSAYDSDLYAAVDYAAAHAKYVSNSWGGGEYTGQTVDDVHFNHPGVAITVSSGDSGYGVEYPASSPYVTAVGGTSLTRNTGVARGWTETAWSGAGSGCSSFAAKPSWQPASSVCTRRREADVAAVADPATGVAVYSTYGDSGWAVYGGTSAAAPIVAAVYALAGTPGGTDYPAAYPYAHTGSLFDITSGANGSCSGALCHAGAGWDGPTGLGTPNGVAAFAPGGSAGVTVTNPGAQTGVVGTAVSLTLSASGGTGPYTWAATGLPTGLSLNASTGVVSGLPTTAGTYAVTVTATSGTASGGATFTWSISANGAVCTAGQRLGNPGFETGNPAPWTSTPAVVSSNGSGETSHSGTWFAWLDGYGTTHTDTLSQTVTIPSTCTSAVLTFWLKITTAETTTTVAFDKLTVKVGATTIATYSNLNKSGYLQRSFNLNAYKGQTVAITFTGTEDSSLATSFVVDDTALTLS
ncbi:MAG TPA: putative Ig domain-containing protein [Rugosimonospora sp.]|nr:putative Ig domain-containing protein [Rugosimonospora sp.]